MDVLILWFAGIPPWLVRKTATTTQIISPTLPEYNEDTPLLVSSTRKSTTTTSFAASKIASPEVLKNGALRPTTMNLSKASSVYNPEIDFKEKQKIGSSTQSTVGSRPMSQQEGKIVFTIFIVIHELLNLISFIVSKIVYN